MPLCQGLPNDPCPARRNDDGVRNGEGDLMLCGDCDKARFNKFLESKRSVSAESCSTSNTDNDVNAPSVSVPSKNGDVDQRKNNLTSTKSGRGKVHGSTMSTAPAAAVAISTRSSASADGNSDVSNVVFNELLMYATAQRDKCNTNLLRSALTSYYSSTEIAAAKAQLVTSFATSLVGCEYITERRNSKQRTASDAEVEDIVEILSTLDNIGVLCNIRFAALQYDRLPRYGPEELNVCAVVDRQVVTDNNVAALTARVESMSNDSSSSSTVTKVLVSVEKLEQQVNLIKAECTKISESLRSTGSNPSPSHTVLPVDRTRNVIITGVDENRDSDVWRDSVSSVLTAASGRHVHIEDAFRLGKYNVQKKRPILVKLTSVWDRRLVLSGARKLKGDVEFSSAYVSADLPPEIRRKHTLDRLKKKAEEEEQEVSVSDCGVLSIDGTDVFCLRRGFLNRVSVSTSRDG